ncbi:MAG: phosphoribosylanthranilate isomerase [Acidimicrobiales bacterium]
MADLDAPFFVKICGVTTLSDANASIDLGADAVGLILATSPRQLSLDRALAIAEAIKGRVQRTLVFRDNSDEQIVEAVRLIQPDAVQIHGPLSDDLLSRLREDHVDVIKALSIGSDEFYDFDDARVDAVMVDGATPGSGESHSWAQLAERPFTVPVIAAGGLNATNVADVIGASSVWGVDSASGVEATPGVKDRDKMEQFIYNAHVAFRERVNS